MKNKIIVFCLLVSFSIVKSNAQVSQSPEQLALHIAQKIKDTLNLHDSVKVKLFTINMQLHSSKMQARQQHPSQSDSVVYKIQKIEKTRDSLYQMVIPPNLFLAYKQKKRVLVSAN